MTSPPLRCVVDTNVPATANGANSSASPDCVARSARALQALVKSGHVFIDAGGLIVKEYRNSLSAKGQPGPGDAFLKWLLSVEWGGERVTRVAVTPKPNDPEDFEELPTPPKGVRYDRSDRKFLAVSAAHNEHPPILQSFDAKWWGWRRALAGIGVTIHFLCEADVKKKHAEKTKR